jgi:hypothetical protein
VRPENVLKQQQSETYDQEQIHVAPEELAKLLKETDVWSPFGSLCGSPACFFAESRSLTWRPLAS